MNTPQPIFRRLKHQRNKLETLRDLQTLPNRFYKSIGEGFSLERRQRTEERKILNYERFRQTFIVNQMMSSARQFLWSFEVGNGSAMKGK